MRKFTSQTDSRAPADPVAGESRNREIYSPPLDGIKGTSGVARRFLESIGRLLDGLNASIALVGIDKDIPGRMKISREYLIV